MMLLTVEEIIELYKKMTEKTGGLQGLRDKGLLESAVFSAYASFDNIDQYVTVEEKSARLAYAITNNHPFADGNKRIGILVMLVTLVINDVAIQFSQQELIRLGLDIAGGKTDYDAILDWIKNHRKV